MSNPTENVNDHPVASYFERVLQNESLKKGAAAAIAGVIVAAVQEAIWPSR